MPVAAPGAALAVPVSATAPAAARATPAEARTVTRRRRRILGMTDRDIDDSFACRSVVRARQGRPAEAFDAPLRFSDLCGTCDNRSYAVPRHCRQQPSAPPVNRGAVFLLAAMGAILLNAPPRDQNAIRATTEWRPVRGRERPSDTYEACQKPAILLTCRMAGRPTRSRYLRRGLVIARGWRGKLARHMRQVGSATAGYHALWPSRASAAGCATALAAGRLEISSCNRPRTSRPPRRHTS